MRKLEKRENIRLLMRAGYGTVGMIKPLAEIEGKRTSHQNVANRILHLLKNKLVTADDVLAWKRNKGVAEANRIIDRYDLQ